MRPREIKQFTQSSKKTSKEEGKNWNPSLTSNSMTFSQHTLASLELSDSVLWVLVKSGWFAMTLGGAGRKPRAALFKGTIIIGQDK